MNNLMNSRSYSHLLPILAGAAFLTATFASAAEENKTDIAGTVKKWQQGITEKFTNALRKSDKPLGTASIDLREQKDSYTLRLHLRDRDVEKVEVALRGNTLHISAPSGENSERYEQSVTLTNAAPNAVPAIERKTKDDVVVVTVAKDASENTVSKSPDSTLAPWTDFDRDIFARMEAMRREMDRVFEDSFSSFSRSFPTHDLFDAPRFGSTVDLQTEGDNYVVRAYLPERDMENVSVTIEERTLKIEARSEDVTKKEGEGTMTSHKAQYSQLLTLPGPVNAEKMDVEKKEGTLVVTIPKA